MKQSFDIVIIGSGPGGYRAAILGALRNKSVAIVEKHLWGGCCLNRGCVPKKAWHNTANLIAQFEPLKRTGINGQIEADFEKAWQHQSATSQQVRDSYVNYMQRLGIHSFAGLGRLLSPHEIEIQQKHKKEIVSAKNIILATGSTPNIPKGINTSAKLISTDELFENPPPKGNEVALIGSGVIAVELAFILSKLGKKIHWYARSPVLQKSEFSAQAINLLKQSLANQDISLPDTNIPEGYIENKRIELQFSDKTQKPVDWVVFATGRKPFTENLGLEQTAISTDASGFIITNEFLQTADPNIYAIGDVRSPTMTANQAICDATVVIENICHTQMSKMKNREIPQAIYSAVEMARMGLNEEQAEDEDLEPATGFAGFESSPTAIGQNDTKGFLRIVADMDSGHFLGGEIVGKNAGELIHIMAMQYDKENALENFAQLLINHPSRSEEIVNAAETLANKWKMNTFVFRKA